MSHMLPTDLRKLLAGCGLPWRIETGTRHYKLIVGKRFAAILPKSPHVRMQNTRAQKNAVAQVRRVIREQQQ